MVEQNSFEGNSKGKRNVHESGSDYFYTKYTNTANKNTFNTAFPFPPKRQLAPSLYSDDIVYNQNAQNSSKFAYSSHRRPYNRPLKSGLTFRSADSTQRALNELTQKRHEAMEKRRASLLLLGLLIFALCVHSTTNNGFLGEKRMSTQDNDKNIIDSTTEDVLKSSEKTETKVVDADTGDIIESDAPLDEVIPEGKEYLQPLRYFASLSTPRRPTDANFFFHIPRSGGQTIKEIVGRCLGKTLATDVGVREGHGQDPTLQTINIDDAAYVNVDTTSVEGLHRAATLGLAESGLADMITSSYFHTTSMLFGLEHKGRAFVLFRNPIERVVSTYYQRTQGENSDLDVSLEDYAQGNGIENNWVTRFLTNQMEGELTKEHLDQAKEIIATKFLVGLISDGEETVKRLVKYFDLSFHPDETRRMEQEDCIKELIKEGTNVNSDGYELPKKGSQAYSLLTWQTQFDIKLYDYAQGLFDEQTREWGSKERKKEMKKKKKKDGK